MTKISTTSLTLGEAIALKRRRLGIKSGDLCNMIKISPSVLSRIEKDMYNVTFQNLLKIASALGLRLALFDAETQDNMGVVTPVDSTLTHEKTE